MKDVNRYAQPLRFIVVTMMLITLTACTNARENSNTTSEPSEIPVTALKSKAIVSVEQAPLRLLPDSASEQIETLSRGSELNLTGVSGDGRWYRVQLTGAQKEAWIAVEFVTVETLQRTRTPTQVSLSTPSRARTTLTRTPVQRTLTIVAANVSPTGDRDGDGKRTPTLVPVHTPTATKTLSPALTFTPETLIPIEIPTATKTLSPALTFTPETPLIPVEPPTGTATGTPPDPPTIAPTATNVPTDIPTDPPTDLPTDIPTPFQ